MSFFAPAAAGLILLSSLIIVQYFLKLRRPPHIVASTFLWRRAVADTRANAPWQKLQAEPLLILQIIAFVALVLALTRPYVLHAGSVGDNLVVVLDASLTTRTTDVSPSRFAAEVARIQSLIDNLPPDKTISLIRLDSHPRVLVAANSDHGALGTVLAAQQPGYDQPDMRTALSLALALAGQGRETGAHAEVLVLHSVNTVLPALDQQTQVQGQVYGSMSAPNLAITTIAAASAADGTVSAIIRVANTGSTSVNSDVEIRADGRLVDVPNISVAPGDVGVVTSVGLPRNTRTLQATLTRHDSLAADNTAWTVLNGAAPSHVLLVTPENIFMRAALQGSPNLTLTEKTPTAYTPAVAQGEDLVIFDGWLPPTLPAANILLINPPTSVLGIVVGSHLRAVDVPHRSDDPAGLLRFMSVEGIHVYQARILSIPAWAHEAMRDGAGPLLLEGDQSPAPGVGRVAVLAFDLHLSDLWSSLDFPVFIANMLNWLAPGLALDRATYQPGEIVDVGIPAGAKTASIRLPDGKNASILVGGGAAKSAAPSVAPFAATTQPGVYTVQEQIGTTHLEAAFAINPGAAVTPLNSGGSLHTTPSSATGKPAPPGKIPLELTGAFTLVVLLVLASEWFVAMRRR